MISDEELENVSGGSGVQCYFRHCIVRGETPERIAIKYNTTTDEIMMLNPTIKEEDFRAGIVLIVPDNR